jgi:hypothetical protein
MIKLGEERKGADAMYPSAVKGDEKTEVYHQTVSLPLKLLGDMKFKKGDRVCIQLEGEITGIHDDEYSSNFQMKAEEGECVDQEDGEGDGGTYLGKES